MNLKELALQLSAITVIANAAKETKDRLRREFVDALDAVGADSVKANLDGEEIAKVSLVTPKATPEITNEYAFTEWVRSNYESEIVQSVRESFRKKILDDLKNVNGSAVHLDTGEVLDFISYNSRDSYISTRFTESGRELITDAFRSGSLSPSEVIAKELIAAA
jgi:aspartate carbamoyltransferase regulatory subunit